jgi:hypothetical protein
MATIFCYLRSLSAICMIGCVAAQAQDLNMALSDGGTVTYQLEAIRSVSHPGAVIRVDLWDGSQHDWQLDGLERAWFGNLPTGLAHGHAYPVPPSMTVFPNPSAGEVTIAVTVAHESAATVEVLDMRGVLMRTLFTGKLGAGERAFRWTGRREDETLVADGTYLCRIVLGPLSIVRPIVIQK